MDIRLRIEDPASFVELMREMKRAGFLRDTKEVILDEDMFPMDIPLDAGKVLEMLGNPVIRKVFGKKMDTALAAQFASVTGTLA